MAKLSSAAGRPAISDITAREQDIQKLILTCKDEKDWQELRAALTEVLLTDADSKERYRLDLIISVIESAKMYDLGVFRVWRTRLQEAVTKMTARTKEAMLPFAIEQVGNNGGIRRRLDTGSFS
ncbi:MAG: hypothetical protein ACOWW1_05575 [archaeon]